MNETMVHQNARCACGCAPKKVHSYKLLPNATVTMFSVTFYCGATMSFQQHDAPLLF